jgi:hypothetical protein
MLLHGNAMPLARRPFGGESCLEFSDSRMVSRYTSVEMIDRTYGHLASRAGSLAVRESRHRDRRSRAAACRRSWSVIAGQLSRRAVSKPGKCTFHRVQSLALRPEELETSRSSLDMYESTP